MDIRLRWTWIRQHKPRSTTTVLCERAMCLLQRETQSAVRTGSSSTWAFVREALGPRHQRTWDHRRRLADTSTVSDGLRWRNTGARRCVVMAPRTTATNRETSARPQHRTLKLHQTSPRQRRLTQAIYNLRQRESNDLRVVNVLGCRR